MAEEKKDSVFNVDHLTNDQIVIVMKKFYEQDGNPDWDMVKDMIDPMDRTNKLKTLVDSKAIRILSARAFAPTL